MPVREENQRERTHAARSASRRHFLEGMRAMVNIAPVAVLLVLAALVHGPVFGGISGYVAVFGGLLAGTSLAFIARKMRLGIFMSIVALFLTYIIFGGLFAIPETTYFRVVPTLRTLQMLVIGIVHVKNRHVVLTLTLTVSKLLQVLYSCVITMNVRLWLSWHTR